MCVPFVGSYVLMMFSLYVIVLFIITFIFLIWTLGKKCHTFPQLKHLMGNLGLYFLDPFFSFIIKFSCYVFDSHLEQSFDLWSVFFIFFEDLQGFSFFDVFSFLVLISYIVRIPCNSSIVNWSISFISSMEITLESNIKGTDLNTFCKIIGCTIVSPSPLMVLTILSKLGVRMQHFIHISFSDWSSTSITYLCNSFRHKESCKMTAIKTIPCTYKNSTWISSIRRVAPTMPQISSIDPRW